jgi:spore germination protein
VLHRATWIAAPMVALVVAGAGLGWWGYNQSQQRQSLANDAENHYAASFHSLVSDMDNLHQELGRSMLLRNSHAFDSETGALSRLSYAAQMDIGQLPITLMPMHNAQSFLAGVAHSSQTWVEEGMTPESQQVRNRLDAYYKESGQLLAQFHSLEGNVMAGSSSVWLTAKQALSSQGPNDNQIVDGFKKADTGISSFVESKEMPNTLTRKPKNHFANETKITSDQAKKQLAQFLHVPISPTWSVTSTRKGAIVPGFIVTGKVADGEMSATISQQGAHILAYHVNHTQSNSSYDFVLAQNDAHLWLENRGFHGFMAQASSQLDHVATFTFSPTIHGIPVVSQAIIIQVGLTQGHILGFDATQYYSYPVVTLPSRVYTANQLKSALSSAFQIREVKPIIAMDIHNNYQPAVVFYGTAHNITYRVIVNAHTSHVISVEQLTFDQE